MNKWSWWIGGSRLAPYHVGQWHANILGDSWVHLHSACHKCCCFFRKRENLISLHLSTSWTLRKSIRILMYINCLRGLASSKRISMWPFGQSSSPKVSMGRTRVMPGVSSAAWRPPAVRQTITPRTMQSLAVSRCSRPVSALDSFGLRAEPRIQRVNKRNHLGQMINPWGDSKNTKRDKRL